MEGHIFGWLPSQTSEIWAGCPLRLGWLPSHIRLAVLSDWAGYPLRLGWLPSQIGLAALSVVGSMGCLPSQTSAVWAGCPLRRRQYGLAALSTSAVWAGCLLRRRQYGLAALSDVGSMGWLPSEMSAVWAGCPLRCRQYGLAALSDCDSMDSVLPWHQYTVTGWDSKFDLLLLPQCCSMYKSPRRSYPEIFPFYLEH